MMVRDGVTSAAPLLELYEWPTMKAMTHTSQTYVTSLSTGFYVAFRGVFAPNTRLAIVYTAFSYMGTYAIMASKCNEYFTNDLRPLNMQIVCLVQSFFALINGVFHFICNAMALITVAMAPMNMRIAPRIKVYIHHIYDAFRSSVSTPSINHILAFCLFSHEIQMIMTKSINIGIRIRQIIFFRRMNVIPILKRLPLSFWLVQ